MPRLSAAASRPGAAADPTRLAVSLILLATVVRLLHLAWGALPIDGDEAQYWLWSQDPAFGYYSKPPLTAWLIGLSTALVGDSTAGVRLFAPLMHAVAAGFILAAARRLFGPWAGFWAALLYVTLPGVSVSSHVMSTDAPLLACWAAALWCVVRAEAEPGRLRWWLGFGAALGLGLLAKYAMAMAAGSLALYLLGRPGGWRVLASRGPLAALALALLIVSPNLWWNWQHQFASIAHLGENAAVQGGGLRPDRALGFLGSQFGVFGPLPFAALLGLVLLRVRSLAADPRTWLLLAFALPQLAMILGVALLNRANANWAAVSYVSAAILVAAWAVERPRWRWLLPASVGFHVVAAAIGMSWHALAGAVGHELTRSQDPFRRLIGHERTARAVAPYLRERPDALLLLDDRMDLTRLSFHLRPRPETALVQFQPRPRNHFELMGDWRAQSAGRRVLYVTALGESTVAEVTSAFDRVRPLATITVPTHRDAALRYRVFELEGIRPK